MGDFLTTSSQAVIGTFFPKRRDKDNSPLLLHSWHDRSRRILRKRVSCEKARDPFAGILKPPPASVNYKHWLHSLQHPLGVWAAHTTTLTRARTTFPWKAKGQIVEKNSCLQSKPTTGVIFCKGAQQCIDNIRRFAEKWYREKNIDVRREIWVWRKFFGLRKAKETLAENERASFRF